MLYKLLRCVKGCKTDECCAYGEECVAREEEDCSDKQQCHDECAIYGNCPPGIPDMYPLDKNEI